jgi:hypothetical protein
MDIPLDSETNYKEFRKQLKKSRKDARKFLDDNALLPNPTAEALAVMDAVLPR